MTHRLIAAVALFVTMAAVAPEAGAQGPGGPTVKPASVPIHVQVILSRYRADKKVSSVPYSLSVKPGERPRGANLRLQTQVPITSAIDEKTGNSIFNYQNIGISIDASATALDAGRYEISVTISESSLYGDAQLPIALPRGVPTLVRTYASQNSLVLRDGQTSQYTAATDPVTGEVVRADVTLTVPK